MGVGCRRLESALDTSLYLTSTPSAFYPPTAAQPTSAALLHQVDVSLVLKGTQQPHRTAKPAFGGACGLLAESDAVPPSPRTRAVASSI